MLGGGKQRGEVVGKRGREEDWVMQEKRKINEGTRYLIRNK